MRLIDADVLKRQIAGMTIANNYPTHKANAWCNLIDAQPTAYDPDKVVERLKEFSKNPCENEKYCKHAYDGFLEKHGCEHCVAYRAIEIVKEGSF